MLLRIVLCCVLASCGSTQKAPRRVTHADCVAAVDHAIALLAGEPAAELMASDKDAYVGMCERTATPADLRCLMEARTATELGLCPLPGGGK